MLERVQIENYRCLREVDVPLKPLTVVIGPNNTGKSAFLSALKKLEEIASVNPHAQLPVSLSDRWLLSEESNPQIQMRDSTTLSNIILSQNQSSGMRGFWTIKGTYDEVRPVSYFGQDELAPKMTSPGVAEQDRLPQIDDKVTNLPAFLDSLLRLDRKRFMRILDTLQELIPGFEDLLIRTPDPATRRIDLKMESGFEMDANLASYGVKLLIFFVALANHPSPPGLILLEEPENGVHPKRLEDIVKLLQGLSEGKYSEHRTQIVLTTHSPYLLDYINVSKSQILVAERNAEDGSRNLRPVDEERLQGFLDEFMLGEIWLNQGEEGLVEKAK